MAFPSHEGSNSQNSAKYVSPVLRNAQLAPTYAVPISASFTPKVATTTKQQIAAGEVMYNKTSQASELAVQQDVTMKKRVEEHTTESTRAVSTTVANTHRLLTLLHDSTLGSEVAEDLWMELEQLFKAANDAGADSPNLMQKQRNDASRHHTSTINASIHGTGDSVSLQHRKANIHHKLTLEQQDAVLHSKTKTGLQLEEVESFRERASRLTLERDQCSTEVDKFKELVENENSRKVGDLNTTSALQKELKSLVSSRMQLQAENNALREATMDKLEQLKKAEQHVADCFMKELEAKADELQKETVKTALLNTLISALNNGEGTTKKFDKANSASHLLDVKRDNYALERAAVCTNPDNQNKKIGILTTDVDRLRQQNTNLKAKLEKTSELAEANKELSKANADLTRQLDDLLKLSNGNKNDAKAARVGLESLEANLTINDAAATTRNDKVLSETIKGLEEEKKNLQAALAEWTELAKRSYKEYKDMLPICKQAVKHRQQARDKEAEVNDLKIQLAAAKASQPNGTGTSTGDAAYWKQKYETLLSTID